MIIVTGSLRHRLLASDVPLAPVDDAVQCRRILLSSVMDGRRAAELGRDFGLKASEPFGFVVGDPNKRHRPSAQGRPIQAEVWNAPVQAGWLWEALLPEDHPFFGRLYVPSAEFYVVLRARSLSLPALVQLICIQCGTFVPDIGPRGYRYGVQPLLRLRALEEAAAALPACTRGRHRLLAALKFAAEGCASVPEARMLALLTTPRSHGGFGIPAPDVNRWVSLRPEAAQIAGQSRMCFDLYWDQARLALEYDGTDDHTRPDDVLRDKDRALAAAMEGVSVCSVSKNVLGDFDRFCAVARWLRELVGGGAPSDTGRFIERQRKAHADVRAPAAVR